MANDSLLRCDLKQSGDIENSELFNINWATELVDPVVTVRVHFLDCGSLFIVVCIDDFVYALCLAPCHELLEHLLYFGKIELSRSTKS